MRRSMELAAFTEIADIDYRLLTAERVIKSLHELLAERDRQIYFLALERDHLQAQLKERGA